MFVLKYTLARPANGIHWEIPLQLADTLSAECHANMSLRFSVRGVEASTQCVASRL